MANGVKAISTAEYYRELIRREKKLGVKAALASDPFEARMYVAEQIKVRNTLKMLKRLSSMCAGGAERATRRVPVEIAAM